MSEPLKEESIPEQQENETDREYQERLVTLLKNKSERFEKSIVKK